MIQADLFWSYGMASGLALAAQKQLKNSKNNDQYFSKALMWNALIFTPSVMWLTWSFPSWQTMYVFEGHSDLPGWLFAILASALFAMSALGFYITRHFIQSGNTKAAYLQFIWSHVATGWMLFIGWDGTGYKRLLYTGTFEQWHQGLELPMTDWFSSPMFKAVLVIILVAGATYVFQIARTLKEARP